MATLLSRSEVSRLQELSAELRNTQEPVVAALDRVRSRVRQGTSPDEGDLAQLGEWITRLHQAGLALEEEPTTFTLSALDEAITNLLNELAAEERNSDLRRMLDEIAAVPLDSKTRPSLEAIVEQARTADPAAMPEETRDAFRALHHVLSTPWHAIDTRDFEAAQKAFGSQAALSAANGVFSPGRESPSTNSIPAPPAASVPAPPTAPQGPAAERAAKPTPPLAEPRPSTATGQSASRPARSGPAEAEPTSRPVKAASPKPAPAMAAPAKPAPETLSRATARTEQPEPESGPPDPRIATALTRGHPGLAYWYSAALKLPAAVQTIFEVLAVSEAITADGDECSLRIRELLHDFDVTSVAYYPEYLKVLAAGCVRSLLQMPFSPCMTVLQDAALLIGDGEPSTFLAAVLHAASFGLEVGKIREEHGRGPAEFITRRDSALSGLSSAMETARNSRTRYARATHVWRRFISEKGPLGGPVSAILTSREVLEPAEHLLAWLRDQRAIDRLIDDTDMQLNPVAAKRIKIEAGARDELREHTRELLNALRSYIEAARAAMNRPRAGTSDQIEEAVESLIRATTDTADEAATGIGDQAIGLVKRWLRAILVQHADLPGAQLPVPAVLARDLSRCFEVRRLDDGAVVPESVTPEVLAAADRPVMEAYEGFVANDDHIGAEQLIDVLRSEGQAELGDQLANRRQEDLRNSRERLSALLAATERELDQALYEASLSESASADLQAELERLHSLDIVDFVAARNRLDGIIAKIKQARDRAIEEARQQLERLDLPEEGRARILGQLDAGDLVNAQEFLAQLAMGAPGLPTESAADETLTQFWPSFVDAMAARSVGPPLGDLRWLEDAAARHDDIAGFTLLPGDSGSMVERGLRGWLQLARTKRGAGWEDSLRDVLNLLGLEVKEPFEKTPHRSQRWWTKIQATPVGQALIPTYGSASAGHYQLLLCWEKASPDRLVELLGEKKPEPPVIALYFGTLSARDRHRLAEYSRPNSKGVSAVVIDNAVIAFLASRMEARLQTTMGITLPFTAINPYTPFALGDVPREVFYGRKEELRRVQDANDALFVYGGRQLGKSALLKTAMREFAETDEHRRSIYIDLRAEGVGEWRKPDDLWPVILPHLQRQGIVDAKVSSRATADVVVPQIRRWLEADPERRILLLLDEADAFLETDARARRDLPGESRFVNVYHLKGLMDGSNRRFKPVFAGLHQVQRFHSASNGPMAHVGTEILVGPLPPPEAYKLVVKPLAAIGYRFERPDVAWRLLAYTNYQASLIQHFCRTLVDVLHHRPLVPGAPPTTVSDRDIDGIYGDKDVRDHIATRFELTINLDNRYRVIAYATASLTLNGDSQVFPAITLYDECKAFWPAGFDGLSLDDFSAYLDEMAGLGILVRTRDDRYGIRSPNVIRLLGSPEEIERRLLESESLELSRPFDPAVFRRALRGNPDRRSPLSEQQVQQILNGRDRVHVVKGSIALGIDRVVEALQEAAPEDIDVQVVGCGALHEVITGLTETEIGHRHLILDLGDAEIPEQHTALRRLHAWMTGDPQRRTASCLASPSADWFWPDDDLGLLVEGVRIRPWTDDSLRAWAPECEYPLGTPKQRAKLLEATGGWPRLVEAAAAAARAGATETRARQHAASLFSDSAAASEFLLSVGLSADPVADEVAYMTSNFSEEMAFDDLVALIEADRDTVLTEVDRAAVLAAITRLVDLGVLSNGSSGDAYLINPLIASLLNNE